MRNDEKRGVKNKYRTAMGWEAVAFMHNNPMLLSKSLPQFYYYKFTILVRGNGHLSSNFGARQYSQPSQLSLCQTPNPTPFKCMHYELGIIFFSLTKVGSPQKSQIASFFLPSPLSAPKHHSSPGTSLARYSYSSIPGRATSRHMECGPARSSSSSCSSGS